MIASYVENFGIVLHPPNLFCHRQEENEGVCVYIYIYIYIYIYYTSNMNLLLHIGTH